MRRDIPQDLQVRRKSDKVLKRLMGKCVECRKEFPKNDMVSITARARRGGEDKLRCPHVQIMFRIMVRRT